MGHSALRAVVRMCFTIENFLSFSHLSQLEFCFFSLLQVLWENKWHLSQWWRGLGGNSPLRPYKNKYIMMSFHLTSSIYDIKDLSLSSFFLWFIRGPSRSLHWIWITKLNVHEPGSQEIWITRDLKIHLFRSPLISRITVQNHFMVPRSSYYLIVAHYVFRLTKFLERF